MEQKRVREVMEYRMELEWPREEIFPLLCPVMEYEWIPHWQCDIIHCETGRAELGCVFTTDFGDSFGREVWVVSHYQPSEKIAFVRTGPLRSTRYEISLSEGSPTLLVWRQEVTSLAEEGDRLVRVYSDSNFKKTMEMLERLLKHYLATGSKLPMKADASSFSIIGGAPAGEGS